MYNINEKNLLLFASNNKHKCFEMKELFDSSNSVELNLTFPFDLSVEKLEVEENGINYHENALIKAKAFYEKFQIPCFSDDSGLEVFELNSQPGKNSARYAGENATDKENRDKLLNEINSINDKSARFVCVICYYNGNEAVYFEGFVQGKIVDSEKGIGGFGYDPIFIPDGYEITFAEMANSEKNKISHRANAVNNFLKSYELKKIILR